MPVTSAGYIATVKSGILAWMESVRYPNEGWGRWKYHAAMTRPWALQASGIAIKLLEQLGALQAVSEKQKQEAVAFLHSCQDTKDHLFKDPLETEADHQGNHSWEQIWGQRNGSALQALEVLGAKPRFAPAPAQFADLSQVNGRAWTLSLDWRNPWQAGESWSRAIYAYVKTLPAEHRYDSVPVLAAMFAAMESDILDPETGMPTRRGCAEDPPRAMAGLFKIMMAYLTARRPVPNAERAIVSTLDLQHENGEFGYRRNMCMNWDALWVLRELDQQLAAGYRHSEIIAAGDRTCAMLMKEYRKADGAFAFHGDHCTKNHHSIRLCDTPQPISDMLGTMMCLQCLEYVDQWHR